MADETIIEEMVIKLEVDYNDAIRQTKTGADRVEQEWDKGAKQSALSFGLIAGAAAAVTSKVIEMASRGAQALVNLGAKAIELRSTFESAEITFSKILGDKEAALAFLDQLKAKAIELKVPFSDATKFAKSILPDTSSVEQFNELLRLAAVGAKDAGLPLQELIFAFNEAVSGDFVSIRDRLDIPKDVIERIKDADDKTAALVEELNKLFTKRGINDISAFSDTLETATSNLNAMGEELLFIAGQAGFETIKEAAQRFLSILQENEPGLEKIAKAVGDIAAAVLDFVSSNFLDNLEEIDTANVLELADSTLAMVENIQLLAETLPGISFDSLVTGADQLVDKLNKALITAVQLSSMYNAELAREEAERQKSLSLGVSYPGGITSKSPLAGILLDEAQAAEVAAAGQEAYNRVILEAANSITETAQKHEELRQARENDAAAADGQAGATDRINAALAKNKQAAGDAAAANSKLADLATGFMDAQEQIAEQREELEADHADRLAQIEEDYQKRKQDIAEQQAEQLAELDEEITKRREDINEQAAEDLAALERDTQAAIAKARQEGQDQEQRETEDHRREMERLERGYLDDLQDAVKARDARAIVDLRRRHQREVREREQDFSTQQRRRREDLEERISEIEANEQQQREEIKTSQEKQLEELAEYEAEKRQDLQKSYDKQMADLEETHAEQIARETESYNERQAELDKALQKRLEATAKALADEKDIDEEGAKAILESLNKYFGAGGDIDALMEDFKNRRREKMQIIIEFEGSTTPPPGNNRPMQTNRGEGQGRHPGEIPGFQFGGIIPGPLGAPRLIMAHAGEEIVPTNEVARLNAMRQGIGGRGDMRVVIEHRGSAPPGVRGPEIEAISATLVRALNDAGIKAR